MTQRTSWWAEDTDGHKLPYLLGIVLLGIIAATFSVSLGADFIWGDDTVNIYNNAHLRSLSAENLGWMFSDYEYVRRYMPLGWLGWALNYQITGPGPWGFHVGNILFHTLTALGIFVLIYRLLSYCARPANTCARWFSAWLGALLWAVHPFRVETVAWASGRIYSQAALFFVLSLLAYLQSTREDEPAERRRIYFWGAVAAYVASLLTYPIALCGAICFLVLDFYPLKRLSFVTRAALLQPKVWLEKIPFAMATVLVMGLTVWARMNTQVFQAPPSLDEFGSAHRFMQAFFVWGCYVWKTWCPVDLAPYYRSLLSFHPTDLPFVLSALLVLGVSVFALWSRRRWPAVLAIWTVYLAMLLPMLGLTEHPHFANDRYAYIVSWGWSILAAAAIFLCWEKAKLRTISVAGGFALAVVCSMASFRQCWRWIDTTTLVEYSVNQLGDHPYRANLLMSYSFYFLERDESQKAAAIYERVLEITPDDPNAHCYLADLLVSEGQHRQAEEHYREAIRLRPHHRIALQNYGVFLAQEERLEEAAKQFQALLKNFPDDARGHHNLSILLAKIGQTEEARLHAAAAERLRPASNHSGSPFQR